MLVQLSKLLMKGQSRSDESEVRRRNEVWSFQRLEENEVWSFQRLEEMKSGHFKAYKKMKFGGFKG